MNSTENSSKLVNWGGYLALSLALALVASIFSVRAGLWQQGLVLYALCCLGASLLFAVFMICMVRPGFSSWRRQLIIRSLAVLPGTFLFLSLLASRGDYPVIHDITTDIHNPPVFTLALEIRDPSANSLEISADTLQLQTTAYPDLKTLHSTLDFEDAFSHATEVAESMGWEVTFSNQLAGVIEAVDTTTIMAFKDDIVIRLQPADSGTLIDLRSASRVGKSDLGANAKRIRAYLSHYKS